MVITTFIVPVHPGRKKGRRKKEKDSLSIYIYTTGRTQGPAPSRFSFTVQVHWSCPISTWFLKSKLSVPLFKPATRSAAAAAAAAAVKCYYCYIPDTSIEAGR